MIGPSRFDPWARGILLAGFVMIFALLIWQLWNLTPGGYCSTVFGASTLAGDRAQGAQFYVTCILKLLDAKTYVLAGLLIIIGIFIVAHVIRETKISATVQGPMGIGGSFSAGGDPVPFRAEGTITPAPESQPEPQEVVR